MVSYVVIPGIDGSDEQHWQTTWEKDWGPRGVRIAPQSWSKPVLDDWVRAIHIAFVTAAERDRDVVLVSHSLGCWAASEWINQNPTSVAGAFMVAPPNPRSAAFPRDAAPTFLDVHGEALTCSTMVVASANDPYCDLGTAKHIAATWRAKFQPVGPIGHINSLSGLGAWPAGRAILQAFVRPYVTTQERPEQ